jgi:hypothetical protein
LPIHLFKRECKWNNSDKNTINSEKKKKKKKKKREKKREEKSARTERAAPNTTEPHQQATHAEDTCLITIKYIPS